MDRVDRRVEWIDWIRTRQPNKQCPTENTSFRTPGKNFFNVSIYRYTAKLDVVKDRSNESKIN